MELSAIATNHYRVLYRVLSYAFNRKEMSCLQSTV